MRKGIVVPLIFCAFNSTISLAAEDAKNIYSTAPQGRFTDIGIANHSTTGDPVTCTNDNGVAIQATPWTYMQQVNKLVANTIVLDGMSAGGAYFYCKAATGDLQIDMVADQTTGTNETHIWIDGESILDEKYNIGAGQWKNIENDFLDNSKINFLPKIIKSGGKSQIVYHDNDQDGKRVYIDITNLSFSNAT